MGWYVTLRVADWEWDWKYEWPSVVTLLFHDGARYVDEPEGFCGYRTTVNKAGASLDKLGITEEYLVSVYLSMRDNFTAFIRAFLGGSLQAVEEYHPTPRTDQEDANVSAARSRLERLDAVRPGEEYRIAVALLREHPNREWNSRQASSDWNDHFLPNIMGLDREDESIPGVVEVSPFSEFFTYLMRSMPEIGLLFQLRLVLATKRPRQRVSLDFTELRREGGQPETAIAGSIEEIVDKVSLYESTFDVLRGGESRLGVELRRARVSRLWRDVGTARQAREKGLLLEEFCSLVSTRPTHL